MTHDIQKIEEQLRSPKKAVRLRALKLLLGHPDATPLQLVKCLCSPDNRNFEFLKVFELDAAMRASWARLRGVDDDSVYFYLQELHQQDPHANFHLVEYILEQFKTKRAAAMLAKIRG